MATACLFLGFDAPRPGREKDAYPQLMGTALSQLDAFKKEGWFESYEAFGLTPHCGNLNMSNTIRYSIQSRYTQLGAGTDEGMGGVIALEE